MKKMSKILLTVLALMLALTVTACGTAGASSAPASSASQSVAQSASASAAASSTADSSVADSSVAEESSSVAESTSASSVAASSAAQAGAADELLGSWALVGAEAEGVEVSMDMLAEMGMDVEMFFNFVSDTEVEVGGAFGGVSESETIEYAFDGSVVSITDQGVTLEMVLADGRLMMDAEGATLIFEKA
jgi:predicted small lipoprotein YifL